MDEVQAAALEGGLPGSEADGAIYGEVIREIDRNGAVAWEWRLADHAEWPFHRNAVRRNYGHANSIHPLEDGDYLLSFKVLNLLTIVSCESGDIVWQFQDDALGGQHDVQMTADGTILVLRTEPIRPTWPTARSGRSTRTARRSSGVSPKRRTR